jgi:cellulose biosynthesis protein BcsQ
MSFRPPEACADAPVDLMICDPAARETSPGRIGRDVHSEVFQELIARARRADRVLIDLSVNCGWMVARMAWMNPTIVVPLVPDLNSVAGLEAVERRFNVMQDAEGRPLQPVYLLNHFDESSALDRFVREALQQELGERLLPFTVRRSSNVREALAEGMTVVEYAPESDVAKDYFGVARWLRNSSVPAAAGPYKLHRGE